jgi:hypothetical protein
MGCSPDTQKIRITNYLQLTTSQISLKEAFPVSARLASPGFMEGQGADSPGFSARA